MNIGICGATGYSGETLVHLLLRHPRARLAAITSRQQAGRALAETMPHLRGRTGDLYFQPSDPQAMAAQEEVAVWFLALPHGVSAEYARPLLAAGKKVFDLSADFRLASTARYQEFYGHEHPAPELLAQAAYAIPELCPPQTWRDRPLIACPGCYPTSVQLPLIPLLRDGLLELQGIVINSYSGLSGAGRQAKEYYSYCERAESLTAYGQPKHRHLSEIEEQLTAAAGAPVVVQFNPHLAPIRRGILTTIVARAAHGATLDRLYSSWQSAFAHTPFVQVLPPGIYPDTAQVQYTNRADLMAHYDPRTGNFILNCALDNLLKGASGQAVQLFNLYHGYPETDGLL